MRSKAVKIVAALFGSAFMIIACEKNTYAEPALIGGGYAASGQIEGVGYMAELYDSTNGLPTSDANCVLSTDDGYIYIGGYSGIIRYDGSTFERLDGSLGLTSGRALMQDSSGRIWVGTNDNGVVVLDGANVKRYTYEDDLPSSSIRSFAEGGDGNIYIGSTQGVSYVDASGALHNMTDERIRDSIIVRFVVNSEGVIYGCTRDGSIFSIKDGELVDYYTSKDIGCETITTICQDPDDPYKVYLGTEEKVIYHGRFGSRAENMRRIGVSPVANVYWIAVACNRVWVTGENYTGYLDQGNIFHALDHIPLDNSIDMVVPDYQGNLWFASSRQGVMKLVANNFQDITRTAGIDHDAVNSTCMHRDNLYVGTDSGLYILDRDMHSIENSLTEYLAGVRVRCIREDNDRNLWITTYTNELGVVCLSRENIISNLTTDDGMPGNKARCIEIAKDGSVLVGTNDGLAVIRDGKVVRCVGASDVVTNTVFLTVCEGDDGKIYAGTDGDGIYVIDGDNVSRIGREDGLSSDVILRITKDEKNGVYWVITSNSIEYIRNGKVKNVDTFPYNNCFEIFPRDDGNTWILSSRGVYCLSTQAMLDNKISDYKLYTIANGLSSAPNSNAFSYMDDNGELYISGRTGVCSVNVNNFFDQETFIKLGVRSIVCNDEPVHPDENGTYVIPSDAFRIQITPAILDYTMTDPLCRVYLEGYEETGIACDRSEMTPLEFTGLDYGDYTLHVQILDKTTRKVTEEQSFRIRKEPRFFEILTVRILMVAIIAAIVGLIVWRVMTGTVIRRQYEQIRSAKDEAERANSAKSRFLANMSHEIRTPINTIMGMDEMILRADSTDVPKGYFMNVINYALDIRSASESLLALINDLLDMSKIESGKMHLVEQGYDTAEILRSIVTMIRVRAREKDLTFDVRIDEDIPKRLFGDFGKIKQVVLNLLTNAVKYTDNGGFTLKVSMTEKRDNECDLVFSVKDTGIGIKPEDMDKLFTAYERLDEEKNSAVQGTGLGLDISRRFAELLGGSLKCESVYGEGSEFILTATQKIEDPAPMGRFTETADSGPKGPYVPSFIAPDADILIVDDNPMNLAVIKGLLRATKVFVTTASSGEECLEKIRYGSFNVVLLDHMMPGMDGVETLERIREDHPDLPVYALTANSTLGADFYLEKGFTGYLAKPIDSRAVERAIMKHIPESMMMIPEGMEDTGAVEEVPADKTWIKEIEGVSFDEGVRNSGGIGAFINSLQLFLDTLEDNAKVIKKAYEEKDYRLYTVKVHSLKSSARIIGAMELSELCEKLEKAGGDNDTKFIEDNTQKLLDDYTAFAAKLARINETTDQGDKPPIPEDELNDAYEALRELVPEMDYDSVEMILNNLKEYSLPEQDAKKMSDIGKMLKTLDWDSMAQALSR